MVELQWKVKLYCQVSICSCSIIAFSELISRMLGTGVDYWKYPEFAVSVTQFLFFFQVTHKPKYSFKGGTLSNMFYHICSLLTILPSYLFPLLSHYLSFFILPLNVYGV